MHTRSITHFLLALCAALALPASWGAEAPKEDAPVFTIMRDGTFDAYSVSGHGPWEFRYAQKLSDKGRTRPRWRPVAEVDRKSPEHGRYLFAKPYGKAAGEIYIGQRIRIPKSVPQVDLILDYQAFCPNKKRSGSVTLMAFDPKVWDGAASDPEKAGNPIEKTLFQQRVHENRDDVTRWTRYQMDRDRLMGKLRSLAGREVVIAVMYQAWHGNGEWMRLDNFGLILPPPAVEAMGWPKTIYRDQPARLRMLVSGDGIEGVAVEYWPEKADGWKTVVAKQEKPGVWVADLPASVTGAPLTARARAVRSEGRSPLMSETHEFGLATRPVHPCVAFNAAELERMRKRIDEFDWAKKEWENVKGSADQWVVRKDDPPSKGGGWSHDYTCQYCGAPLRFREDHPHEHICKKCGKITKGEKPDATWRGTMHGRFIGGAKNMGLTWQMTGDDKYARQAIRILKWYADHYADFPMQARRGKVHWQSLTESSWLTSVVEAADLVYNAMTDEEKWAIETDLIRAGAEHVAAQRCGYSNWRCWYNACLGTAGYFLGDPDLISRARDGEGGYKYMIDKGVLPDGLWYERSIGYHNYSLAALIHHTQADRHAGGDLWKYGRFPMMFTAELRLAFPDLVSPSLNDMGYRSARVGTRYLTYGWAWYKDAMAGGALNALHKLGASRVRLEDWHVSEPIPADLKYQAPPSENMSGVGMAILRQGDGKAALCAMLEYGEHGGGHGHPDKLQILFYGLAQPLCPDLGTARYGSPLYRGWFKTTPGHNTVTIGGRNMEKITGELVGFRNAGAWSAAAAKTDKAYPGYMLTRRILLSDRFLVDVFDVEGRKPDTLDWFLRSKGDLAVSVPVAPANEKPLSTPYKYLKDVQAGRTDDAWDATWTLPAKAGRLVLRVAGVRGTEVARMKAPGIPGETWDTLRIRRQAARSRFAVVYQTVRGDAKAEDVAFDGSSVRVGGSAVQISGDDGVPVLR